MFESVVIQASDVSRASQNVVYELQWWLAVRSVAICVSQDPYLSRTCRTEGDEMSCHALWCTLCTRCGLISHVALRLA